jgi:hypothetical protein
MHLTDLVFTGKAKFQLVLAVKSNWGNVWEKEV